MLKSGLTPNAISDLRDTILTIACNRAPKLVLYTSDSVIAWFQDLNGDSSIDIIYRKEIPEVDYYLFLNVDIRFTIVKTAVVIELIVKDSPEYYNYAITAIQM